MSLNQIINPIKPLDVVFGNITADNLEGSETRILKDVAGADFVAGDNVNSTINISKQSVFFENKGDLIDEGVGTFKQVRYFCNEGSIKTPPVIVAGKEAIFEFTLIDPAITTEYIVQRKNLVVATGVVNDGVNDLLGNFYLDTNDISAGQIVFKFISIYGLLKPNTDYKVVFDVDFAY